jgi:ABC-2 type transport system permease protein
MMLFVTVTMYGVMVLRAVVDEKSSRVMEVMLASATPKQMMAGKVLGVGAVGLSQLGIWSIAAAIYGTPGLVMASVLGFTIPKEILIGLPVFFVLGYVLYSACFAALGATVNSEQEAQQLQMIVMLPLILASSFMWEVIRHPDSATSIFLSLFPFTSPVLMFMRMAVATPPLWQVLLCVALLIATVYLVISICARIYRVGILMYGKRPTLPEIIKWLRYA